MSSPIKTVGVIGAGVIGVSWTALFLAKGVKVIITDPAPGAEANVRNYLREHCSAVPNATVPVAACLDNFKFVKSIDPYLDSLDLIQENGPERVDFKRRLFAHLDANTPSHVLIASSSSGIPASQFVTECTNNPARILVGHPFNPPHLVPLVEIAPHPGTSEKSVALAYQFYQSLGKDPVVLKKETPGFVANRLQAAICAEAYSLISRGIVTAEELDKTVTSGLGLRWALTGPIMTNTLAGGGSFMHFMDHLGPAVASWIDDMEKHRFDMGSQDEIDDLKKRVDEWVSHVDLKKNGGERDALLVDLVRNKIDQAGRS